MTSICAGRHQEQTTVLRSVTSQSHPHMSIKIRVDRIADTSYLTYVCDNLIVNAHFKKEILHHYFIKVIWDTLSWRVQHFTTLEGERRSSRALIKQKQAVNIVSKYSFQILRYATHSFHDDSILNKIHPFTHPLSSHSACFPFIGCAYWVAIGTLCFKEITS